MKRFVKGRGTFILSTLHHHLAIQIPRYIPRVLGYSVLVFRDRYQSAVFRDKSRKGVWVVVDMAVDLQQADGQADGQADRCTVKCKLSFNFVMHKSWLSLIEGEEEDAHLVPAGWTSVEKPSMRRPFSSPCQYANVFLMPMPFVPLVFASSYPVPTCKRKINHPRAEAGEINGQER